MRERLASVRSLIDIPLAVVIALLLYIGVIYLIVPYLHVIPVARERMVEMKEFLDDQANA